MSDTDHALDAVERLDYMDGARADRPGFDRRAFLRRTAMTGVAAGSVGTEVEVLQGGPRRVERAKDGGVRPDVVGQLGAPAGQVGVAAHHREGQREAGVAAQEG